MKGDGSKTATGTQNPPSAAAQALLRAYRSHLASERRLAEHTVRNYTRDINALILLAGATPLA